MPAPLHTLRLQPDPTRRDSEAVYLVTGRDSRASAPLPLFRAPTFPTPHQLGSEVPFSVNLRYRVPMRS